MTVNVASGETESFLRPLSLSDRWVPRPRRQLRRVSEATSLHHKAGGRMFRVGEPGASLALEVDVDNMYSVGIDVSAKTLAVAWRDRRGKVVKGEFVNNAAGHAKLLKRLAGSARRVCLEATGIYHLDVALTLHQTDNVEVMVANPRAVHDFAGAMMTRNKTDSSDAEVLLAFADRMPWQAWKPPSTTCFELRALCRHGVSLRERLVAEKSRIARSRASNALPQWILEDIEQGITQLQARIDKLDAHAATLVAADERIAEHFELLLSIPGIGQASGMQVLSELAVLPADMTARQWVAHAGLDPRRHQSGSTVDRPARISKAGNRYVRRALYMPALVAIRHDARVRAFYDELVARGKAPRQAIVAVMRKLLHAIWGMFKSNSRWEGERFRASTP
ncbi:MAG TPA: IS110 family transposase, partial [Planctomycetes bacterium]|nr:IS110 family transposase [Planctomycetota bacterium]